jgi:hypothetical protein
VFGKTEIHGFPGIALGIGYKGIDKGKIIIN